MSHKCDTSSKFLLREKDLLTTVPVKTSSLGVIEYQDNPCIIYFLGSSSEELRASYEPRLIINPNFSFLAFHKLAESQDSFVCTMSFHGSWSRLQRIAVDKTLTRKNMRPV